jgi:single-strand DNA-binding protein
MNEIVLSGRLTRDLEPRYTQTGKCHVSFSLAVDKGYGDNKKTLWVNCTAWEKTAETMGNNLGKGRKILIKGELDQYEIEKDGVKKRVDQVIVRNFEFMDSKKEQSEQMGSNMAGGYDVSSLGTEVFPEESIPF